MSWSRPNTFAGSTLDRVSHLRTDDVKLAELTSDTRRRVVGVGRDGPLLADGLPDWLDGPLPEDAVLLGVDDHDRSVFAVARDDEEGTSLRDAAHRLSPATAGLLAYATAMIGWHRRHGFCANCGHATEPRDAGHVRKCPNCGATHHPRTDPVVIMLVRDDPGDRVLLGRQGRWPAGRYSALAGFVEPGESLEAAVAREVEEEANVVVGRMRYHSSQPWPFPASLMVGFHADHAGGEPRAADDELEDVRWFEREELERIVSGHTDLHVPPPAAIARRLIDDWLEEA